MKDILIAQFMTIVGKIASKEVQTKALDAYIDVLEDAITDSATPLDDLVLLPVIKALRGLTGIPDNDLPEV